MRVLENRILLKVGLGKRLAVGGLYSCLFFVFFACLDKIYFFFWGGGYA